MSPTPAASSSVPIVAASRPWYWPAVLWYVRRELPAWGRFYDWLGGTNPERWSRAGIAQVRGKLHGYTLELDLANWSERLSWCLARYHDLPIQLLLQRLLVRGDCFVDIGANLGMLTLLARACVGSEGLVIACEPNPRLRSRIEAVLRENRIDRVELVGKAIGAAAGTAVLHEFAGHSGWGSLSANGPEGAAETAAWTVPVARADDVLAAAPANAPVVIKIDVEGHEVPVLRGLQHTLTTRWPAVLVEVADQHQRRAGYSAALLRAELEQHGYRGFAAGLRRRGVFGRRLSLRPLAEHEAAEVDAVFLPPRGPLAERAARQLGV